MTSEKCYFHDEKENRCIALTGIPCHSKKFDCYKYEKCHFYKTREQFEEGRKKYPYRESIK